VDAVAANDVFALGVFTVRAKIASLSWIDIARRVIPGRGCVASPDTGVSTLYVTGVIAAS
jgi:hypothetical protein